MSRTALRLARRWLQFLHRPPLQPIVPRGASLPHARVALRARVKLLRVVELALAERPVIITTRGGRPLWGTLGGNANGSLHRGSP
jgi:hypothetical protein